MKVKLKSKVIQNKSDIVVETKVLSPSVDRPRLIGFRLDLDDIQLANRLSTAINAGKVFSKFKLQKDVDGKTYIQADRKVFGRRMNADLNRLGY